MKSATPKFPQNGHPPQQPLLANNYKMLTCLNCGDAKKRSPIHRKNTNIGFSTKEKVVGMNSGLKNVMSMAMQVAATLQAAESRQRGDLANFGRFFVLETIPMALNRIINARMKTRSIIVCSVCVFEDAEHFIYRLCGYRSRLGWTTSLSVFAVSDHLLPVFRGRVAPFDSFEDKRLRLVFMNTDPASDTQIVVNHHRLSEALG
ncbi:MAG: hypothetical protein GY866_07365 [Proteobacteria bacterium]|nr:hypothetical protein [Pseudomonadota bacterium]